nr:HAMP domain-containing sensor histidine kinase [uncultured Marinifilum sp.]
MVLLIIIQVRWFTSAIDYQQKESHQKLNQIIPDIALEINGINHTLFHKHGVKTEDLPKEKIENKIDSVLKLNGFDKQIYYAIYQADTDGIFLSNTDEYQKELLRSDIKSCLSSIISFSFAEDNRKRKGERDEEFNSRIIKQSTFQYFSPVIGINQSKESDLWLSLYQERQLSNDIASLLGQFILNILLLIILFILLVYLLKSLAKHKKMSQIKNDFFNNLSHEFKLPIGSIRLASKVLRQATNEEKKNSYHKIIENESELLEEQVDKLLRFSMFENEFSFKENQELNLHEIIKCIPEKLKILIEKNNAELKLDLQSTETILVGDKDMLISSFVNIVENSLKYSEEGVTITISTSYKAKQRVIRIIDNGPGIDPKFENQIFDRFFRANQENQYQGKGFGIGLSYVKSIIEAHNGTIKLLNHYPKGCEFVINL